MISYGRNKVLSSDQDTTTPVPFEESIDADEGHWTLSPSKRS